MIFKLYGKFEATDVANLPNPATTDGTALIQATDDRTLRQRLMHGPPEWTWATSDEISRDDGHIIADAIRAGNAIVDGDVLYKEEIYQIAGAYRFTIDISQGEPCHLQLDITGDCNIPRTLTDNNWTRAELRCIYTVICVLEKLCNHQTITSGRITIGSDRKSAIWMVLESRYRLSPYAAPLDISTSIRSK